MSTLNKIGLWLLGIGMVLLFGRAAIEIVRDFLYTNNVPGFVKWGIALVFLAFVVMLIALIIERIKDKKYEDDTLNN